MRGAAARGRAALASGWIGTPPALVPEADDFVIVVATRDVAVQTSDPFSVVDRWFRLVVKILLRC